MRLTIQQLTQICKKVNRGEHYSSLTAATINAYIEKQVKNTSGTSVEREEREAFLQLLRRISLAMSKGELISNMLDTTELTSLKGTIRSEMMMVEGTPEEKADAFFSKEHRELRPYTFIFTKEQLIEILSDQNASNADLKDVRFSDRFAKDFIDPLIDFQSKDGESAEALSKRMSCFEMPYNSISAYEHTLDEIIRANEKNSMNGKRSMDEAAAIYYRDKLMPAAREYLQSVRDQHDCWTAITLLLRYPRLAKIFHFDYDLSDPVKSKDLVDALKLSLRLDNDEESRRIIHLLAPRYGISLPHDFIKSEKTSEETNYRYQAFLNSYANLTGRIEMLLDTKPIRIAELRATITEYCNLFDQFPEYASASRDQRIRYTESLDTLDKNLSSTISALQPLAQELDNLAHQFTSLKSRHSANRREYYEIKRSMNSCREQMAGHLSAKSEYDAYIENALSQFYDSTLKKLAATIEDNLNAFASEVSSPTAPSGIQRRTQWRTLSAADRICARLLALGLTAFVLFFGVNLYKERHPIPIDLNNPVTMHTAGFYQIYSFDVDKDSDLTIDFSSNADNATVTLRKYISPGRGHYIFEGGPVVNDERTYEPGKYTVEVMNSWFHKTTLCVTEING